MVARFASIALAAGAVGTAMPIGSQVPASPVSITGTFVSAADDSVVIAAKGGTVTVAMTPNWTVGTARAATVADIRPGDFIATTNTNVGSDTGRSTEVRVFERGYEPEHGTHPMPKPNTSMTHGTVSSVAPGPDETRLVVTYAGGSRYIIVPAGTGITAYDLKGRDALAPGVMVNAITRKGADGVPRAGRLLLVQP